MPPTASAHDAFLAAATVWMFAVGGAVGSFLNVVAYRLPRGLSLVWPGSHCPACKHPIRWFDNVPILGWLWLRGRCRDCHAKISPRYPIVEALTATLFAVFFLVECGLEGINLPRGAEPFGRSLGQLGGICAFHLVLLCTLLAAALVQIDGHRVPLRLAAFALVVGLAAPLVWPELHPVHAWAQLSGRLAGLVDGPLGLAAGLFWGWLLGRLFRLRGSGGLAVALGCGGLFLGWQAATALALATAGWWLAARACGREGSPLVGLAATATIGILAWAPLAGVVQFG